MQAMTIKIQHICLQIILVISSYFQVFGQTTNNRIEIFFTRPITARYQNPNLFPYGSGGSVTKQKIIDEIKNAKSTVDVCVYNNTENDIVDALKLVKAKGVRIRYITDSGTGNSALKGNPGFPILYLGKNGGIMHNKFVIIDAANTSATLLFGSANFTPNAFNDDANNLLVMRDQSICETFTTEFEEMWGGSGATPGPTSKSGNQKNDNTPHEFNIAGIPINVYFSPSDHTENNILTQLAKADFNLRFAIYTFTSDALANAIIERKKANLIIRGITDNNTDNSGKLTYLQQNGVDVIDHLPSSLMHHKYAVLDAEYQDSDPVVITGSHNWTWSADNINDESTMFIHDMDIAKLYVAEFNSRYCELAPWDCNLLDVKEYVNADIKIFPSITSGLVQLQSNGNNRITSIFIADQISRPVYYTKSTLEMNLHMDISFLQPGIYFITVSGEQAGYATSKIIKI